MSMETYQPIFDAVRLALRNTDVGEAVENVLRAEGLGEKVARACDNITYEFAHYGRPSTYMRPKVFADGNMFCCLLGENIQEGVCGFGDTPDKACYAFDKEWTTPKSPAPSDNKA